MEQNAPRLRFPQFTAAWGKKALGEIIKEYDKRTSKDNEDILLSCTTGGIFLNSDIFSHQRGKSTKGYKKVSLNTLILSAQNLHLGNANVNFKFKSGIISPAYNTYEIAKENPIFISEWIKTKAFYAIVNKCSSIGASACRRNIEWTNLYKSIIRIPSLPEQEKIADFFTALDEKIDAKEKEIEDVKALKKGFLQQLFPQEGETVPRLRFPGFTGTWEKKKLGEIASPIQKNSLSRDDLNYTGGHYKDIHYGDILIKFGSLIDTSDSMVPYINEDCDFKIKAGLLQQGDIIFADTAEDKTAGKAVEISDATFPAVAGLHTLPYRPNIDFYNGYLGAYLNSPSYHTQLMPLLQGIKVLSITKPEIEKTVIAFPSLPEQEKIADFFSALDEKIEAMEKQRDALKAMKKGFLQQMFI